MKLSEACSTVDTCPLNTERCADGICRGECPEFNGCFGDLPVQCPSGICVADKGDTSCLGLGKCRFNEYTCPDNTCAVNIESCDRDLKGANVIETSITVSPGDAVEVTIASDNGLSVSSVILPAGIYRSNSNYVFECSPVAESYLQKSKIPVDVTRQSEFGDYLTYSNAGSSVAVSCSIPPTVSQPLDVPVLLSFRIHKRFNTTNEDYCLAVLNESKMEFECVDKSLVEIEDKVLQGRAVHFSIYTVVFSPRKYTVPPDVTPTNFFEKYLVQFIVGVVCLVLFCLVASYVTFRLNRYRKKWLKVKRHLANTGHMGHELVQYDSSQSTMFEVDDGVESLANPMFELKREEMLRKMASQSADLQLAQSREKDQVKINEMEYQLEAMRTEMARLKKESQITERTEGTARKLRKSKKKAEFAGEALL